MDKKIVNQIKRVLKHNETILDDLYGKFLVEENGIHFMEREQCAYARSIGWVEALEFVINAVENGSPVADTPLIDEDVSAEIQMLRERKEAEEMTQLIGDFIKTKENK